MQDWPLISCYWSAFCIAYKSRTPTPDAVICCFLSSFLSIKCPWRYVFKFNLGNEVRASSRDAYGLNLIHFLCILNSKLRKIWNSALSYMYVCFNLRIKASTLNKENSVRYYLKTQCSSPMRYLETNGCYGDDLGPSFELLWHDNAILLSNA